MISSGPNDSTGNTGTNLDWKFIVEVVVAVVAIATFIATSWQAKSSADQARLTADQAEKTTEQLKDSRYQSVYERVLELEKLPLDKTGLARYLIGGDRLPPPPKDRKKPDREAANRAAIIYALDIYQYVWKQLGPEMPSSTRPGSLVLRGDSIEKPLHVSDGDWEAWQTWSETIKSAFQGGPEMCRQLADSTAAFPKDFLAAIATLDAEVLDGKVVGCTNEERDRLLKAANR